MWCCVYMWCCVSLFFMSLSLSFSLHAQRRDQTDKFYQLRTAMHHAILYQERSIDTHASLEHTNTTNQEHQIFTNTTTQKQTRNKRNQQRHPCPKTAIQTMIKHTYKYTYTYTYTPPPQATGHRPPPQPHPQPQQQPHHHHHSTTHSNSHSNIHIHMMPTHVHT